MLLNTPLILASRSPRRSELLSLLGIEYRVVGSDDEPPPLASEKPNHYVLRAAKAKVQDVSTRVAQSGASVLGADTVVVLDGVILGKPSDDSNAEAMLESLQGRWHDVFTGVVLLHQGKWYEDCVQTKVRMVSMSSQTIRNYVASGEGRDKAGSYAAQGLGAGLIKGIQGSYSNVVGLPAAQSIALLLAAGVLEQWP
ncbi:MAG: septum formation protein Maf [Myxococcales bacterium]|nr:MAG: septum formation protein Maf [Myxococcales bacterium]